MKKIKAWAVVTKRGMVCGYRPFEVYERQMDALDALDSYIAISKNVAAWTVKPCVIEV